MSLHANGSTHLAYVCAAAHSQLQRMSIIFSTVFTACLFLYVQIGIAEDLWHAECYKYFSTTGQGDCSLLRDCRLASSQLVHAK